MRSKAVNAEVMVRVLVLKRLYNLSDEQMEYQLRARLSFLRFARLGLGDAVPDSRTIWLYADQLAKADGARELFEEFNRQLAERGLLVKEGMMVEAPFAEVPRQRNSREDNAKVRQGETPSEWLNQPRKLAQKEVDARWSKKNDQSFYGYKDHIKVEARAYRTTPTSTHDSQPMPELIEKGDLAALADSAYTGEKIAAICWLRACIIHPRKKQRHDPGDRRATTRQSPQVQPGAAGSPPVTPARARLAGRERSGRNA